MFPSVAAKTTAWASAVVVDVVASAGEVVVVVDAASSGLAEDEHADATVSRATVSSSARAGVEVERGVMIAARVSVAHLRRTAPDSSGAEAADRRAPAARIEAVPL